VQHLTYVAFGIDEALRYMRGGRPEEMRLALVLLDNAAELQLDRRVRRELALEEVQEARRLAAIANPDVHRSGHIEELINWTPLSRKQKERLNRYFDAKLAFLSERHSIVDARVASVLSHLHKYRNEAYHEARLRPETIATATAILIEVNCTLLETIRIGPVHSSADDYSWLRERFGADPQDLLFSIDPVVTSFRKRVRSARGPLGEELADHLDSRLEELRDGLNYVVSATSIETEEEVLVLAQLPQDFDVLRIALKDAAATVHNLRTTADLDMLATEITAVREIEDSIDSFNQFAELEAKLESIENPVNELVRRVDESIQLEVDMARGK
jgi:hypothetical protein